MSFTRQSLLSRVVRAVLAALAAACCLRRIAQVFSVRLSEAALHVILPPVQLDTAMAPDAASGWLTAPAAASKLMCACSRALLQLHKAMVPQQSVRAVLAAFATASLAKVGARSAFGPP